MDDEAAEIEGLESALSEAEDEKERLKEQLGKLAKSEWDRQKKEFIDFVRQTRGDQTASELDQKIQPDSPYSLDTYRDAFNFGKTQTSPPTGKVSLPPPPQPRQGEYSDTESMVADLTLRTLSSNKKISQKAKEQLKVLRSIAKPIAQRGISSGHAQEILQIRGSYGVCPKCGMAQATDFNIKGTKCKYCDFESGTSRMFKRELRR